MAPEKRCTCRKPGTPYAVIVRRFFTLPLLLTGWWGSFLVGCKSLKGDDLLTLTRFASQQQSCREDFDQPPRSPR